MSVNRSPGYVQNFADFPGSLIPCKRSASLRAKGSDAFRITSRASMIAILS